MCGFTITLNGITVDAGRVAAEDHPGTQGGRIRRPECDIEVQAVMKGNPLGRPRLVSLPGRHGRFDRRAGQPLDPHRQRVTRIDHLL